MLDDFLTEERLREVLGSAKDRRMQQLEKDFAARKEYVEAAAEKQALLDQLEALLQNRAKNVLGRYDDVWALLLCRAQDFFYDRGFMDCFHLFMLLLRREKEEKQ